MSLPEPIEVAAGAVPAPEFEVVGAAHVPFAAVPTMGFTAIARERSGIAVQSIGLSAQVMIDPARRGYDPETRERLAELFGPPERWTPSTSGLAWARVAAAVPAFTDETGFQLQVPCAYDLEVAAAKYFYAVRDGVVPLSFHFNGTVFYHDTERRVQMTPIAWSTSARYGMAVDAWRAMIAEHYPGGGWIRLSDEVLEAVHERRAARGHATVDALLRELLEQT